MVTRMWLLPPRDGRRRVRRGRRRRPQWGRHPPRDAAASRLGYAGPVRSLRTTGRVYGGLLAHSFRRAQACFDAMESRCYDGGIRFLTREKPVRAPHALVCGALTAGMVLALVCGA